MNAVKIPHAEVEQTTVDAASLFRAHGDFVARFLHRLNVPSHEIDDLVQDVFLVVHRRGGFEPGKAKATTYLAKIALLLSVDQRRLQQRRKTDPNSEGLARVLDEAPTPEERALLVEDVERAQRAIDTIPPERRALFILFELEDEPCNALAVAFDIPLRTVHSRLRIARREFFEAYERLGKEESP
ncbi:RNA polymerase sigma factor RpoE [Labilithrix luteola]|uniref:RNA polymerase sigma factor RpoE n=1 Tax=Labilithrix luteola TaxID=1391654 RepID=A0A0K1PPQ5_9BACT|nr:RNA polymerase sigma factor [Labilithrix luteola]AKU95104.1 RNA polymerase sigma factor RpoE [Labilithrix luteola]